MAVTVDSGSSGDPTGAGTGDGEATSDFGDAAETGGDGDGVEAECMAAGRYERAIELDGVVHRFTVHVPASRGGMAPLVMQLHGGGSTAAAMDTVSGLTALAEQEGFVVVSPEGWAVGGGTQVWNGGACCGPSAGAPDHVAALARILDETVSLDGCIDERRVYVTGHSNGGIMSYRLACELSERIAAVAVSAGYLADRDESTEPPTLVFDCVPTRAVPILHVHGLADQCVPYVGGYSEATGKVSPAIEDVNARWRELDGCGSGTDVTEGEVRRRRWACVDGTEVELITVESLGHAWAGSAIYGHPDLCGGTTTTAVSTTLEAWRFFEAHSLP